MKRFCLSFIIAVFAVVSTCASLTGHRVGDALRPYASDSSIGIAVILPEGDTIGVNSDRTFPLESVMKFYQAVALSHLLGDRLLTDSISVGPADLKAATWSPMRAKYSGETFSASPAFLLDYSLRYSDNNAADILFDRYGSPKEVDSVLRMISRAKNFSLRFTESDMHADTSLCSLNFATPADAATLFFDYFCLDSLSTVVRAIMSHPTPFGVNRLAAGFPAGKATLLHKTGTGFNAPGRTGNVNDVGFVFYPRSDGSFGYYSIAVFVADREGAVADAEALIAQISESVWTALMAADADYALRTTVPAGKPNAPVPTEENHTPWFALVGSAIIEAMIDNALGLDEP